LITKENTKNRHFYPKTVIKPIIFKISENPIFKAKSSSRRFQKGIILPVEKTGARVRAKVNLGK
jgi:hypothetical protein